MDALRCPPADAPVATLSGGERRRVALCALLLRQPDLLLLDEPTNHLDAESVQWLEQHLAKYPGAVLAVTHDRYFLDNVAEWILELDRGHAYPYEGNYSTYLETKQSRLKVEGRKDAKRQRILEQELEWVRSNPKARQAKSKARLQRYEELAAEAERTRKLDFEEIQIPPGPRLGVGGRRGGGPGQGLRRPPADRRPVVLPAARWHRRHHRAERRRQDHAVPTIIGEEKPDDGILRIGETVRLSYVDQGRSGLDPKKTVWQVVSDGLDHIKVGNVEMPSRAYVSAFGFKGPDQQKPAGVLSGGERNRLNLALTLKQGGNLLLLDEPTNDLDVETLQSLENALLEFPGCAVVISHDRWFLDRVATHILAWEGTDADPASGSGSRATSPTTRRTRSTGSGSRRPGRTASPTASSRATRTVTSRSEPPAGGAPAPARSGAQATGHGLRPRGPADGGDAAVFLGRVTGLDPAALVRLRDGGGRVTGYARLPFGVLVSRTIGRAVEPADVTVAAADLLAAVDPGQGRPAEVPLPASRDVEWRAPLPPLSGWQRLDEVPADVVRSLVRAGADDAPGLARRRGRGRRGVAPGPRGAHGQLRGPDRHGAAAGTHRVGEDGLPRTAGRDRRRHGGRARRQQCSGRRDR